jgi:monoamine oxidase
MCAAYELDRAGYDVTVIEPDRRIGGRSLTLRRGDAFREVGAQPVQECRFDDGLWLNAGPGRIPHHHVTLIGYCRRLGVALQPYVFASRANLVHAGALGNAGRTVAMRRMYYDLQGHVAELLDKCVAKGAIEAPVTGTDLEKLREMLAMFGDLSKIDTPSRAPAYSYKNQSGRAGFDPPPGTAAERGKPLTPLALEEILRSNVWNDWLLRDADYFWQTSLLEPVGGMDNFVKGFARQPLSRRSGTVGGLVRFGAAAQGIEVRGDRVAVSVTEAGGRRTLAADYCISTVPMPLFRTFKTNLPPAFMAAAAALPTYAAGKVGWQAERFWETHDNIYGGISWTTDTIDQVWYPSDGYLSRKGTLTGAYMRGATAERFNALSVDERLRIAREQGEKLHPGNFARLVEHGLAIGWNNMEFERMAWADETDPAFEANALALSQPQGRLVLAGDQITFLSGWQEGALLSAQAAVTAIDRHARGAVGRG